MNIKKIKHITLKRFALLLAIMMLLSSCGMGSKTPTPQQQSTQSEQQSEKIPDQLKKVEESIEKIFKDLNGPAVALKEEEDTKKGSQQEKTGQDTKEKSSDKGGSEEKSKDGGSENSDSKGDSQKQDNQQQKETPQQPAPEDPWKKINTAVNELHYQWNAYTPMAAKAGASRELIDNFSNALNGLTNTINTKNQNNILLGASYLYGYMPDFFYLYKTKSSPEIKKIRHYIRNSMLNGMNGNWAQADTDVNNLKASWSMYKNIVQQEQQETVSKLDFAIYEYEKVVKEKSQQLIDIKGRVALSDVEALEKAMEEGAKNKS